MPIMFPAPALFSTKNCWPSALEKCCASTRPTMSVPPPGGEGTTILTGLTGYSCPAVPWQKNAKRRKALAQRTQTLERLCRHQHERDHARHRTAVHPVVDRALLHQHVALPQLDGAA